MNRLLILVFILPISLFSKPAKFSAKADLGKVYSQAIGDFIKAANAKNKSSFDTLFFGKRINGQPDDFPDIQLPLTIEHTQIRLITPEAGTKLQKQRKARIYINLVGWVEKENAEFIFVVFSNGFEHQYDCQMNYKYNAAKGNFELDKLHFKEPPFDK
jgi:hypothetical protein